MSWVSRALWRARFYVVHLRSLRTMHAWQEHALTGLIRHASAHIPLYRDSLRDAGVDPTSVRTLRDLARIPITTKSMFLTRAVEEYTDTSREMFVVWRTTSGTSGAPFSVVSGHVRLNPRFNDFSALRFLTWKSRTRWHYRDIRVARVMVRPHASKNRLGISVREFLDDPSAATARLAAFKPDVLESYASILLEIARIAERGVAAPKPAYVVSFGETLSSALRKRIAAALHADVYDRYGIEEVGVIGTECDHHSGYHINMESVIVEIVDESGSPLPPEHAGRVVVTDLFNYNMPFIRYDTGDWGSTTNEPCECGLRAPRLWIDGRHSLTLTFNGKRVHHLEIDAALDGSMYAVIKYQAAKIRDDLVRLRIIPGPHWSGAIGERLRESLRALTGADVEIELVQSLHAPRGKSRIAIDESHPSLSG